MTVGRRAALACALLAAGASAPLPGQSRSPDSLAPRIQVITVGPGPLLWEWFGHNMIRVTDPATGSDLAYNFGIFDFKQKNFYWNFLQGRMRYALDAWPAQGSLEFYRRMGRAIDIQDLALTPGEARTLAAALVRNAEPDQRLYQYDYFRDNCSTRVRDALNRALGGALEHELGPVPAGATYRSITGDLTSGRPLAYFGLMLLLGPAADDSLTDWTASFIPMILAHRLALMHVTEPDGSEVQLVSGGEYLAARANDDGAPGNPAALLPWFLVAGVLLGGVLAWAGARAGAGKGRGAFVTLAGLWSLLTGLVGFLLVYLWAFTDHAVAYRNENVLQASALGLLLFASLAAWVRGRPVGRTIRVLAYTIAAVSLAGVALKFVPGPNQVNGVVLAFFLPANIGMALAARRAVPPVTT